MSWKDLVAEPEHRSLPWTGGRMLASEYRTWSIEGDLPPEHEWATFRINGTRTAWWVPEQPGLRDEALLDRVARRPNARRTGTLVGHRLVVDGTRVDPDPDRMIRVGTPVFLLEDGIDRFSRISAVRFGNRWVFHRVELPIGPEPLVAAAWEDRKDSVADIPGVPPALDLAFRIETRARADGERRRAEADRVRAAAAAAVRAEAEARALSEAQAAAWAAAVTTRTGRMAGLSFEEDARRALALTDSELLDWRRISDTERVVRFRYRQQRFQAVVDARTLQILDAGICLTDRHGTHDREFTLQSLPSVIGEAMDTDQLVVLRHG